MFLRSAIIIGVLTYACAAASADTVTTETSADPSQSSNSMEQPAVGDHWTYEIRDELTGLLKATTTNTITEITPTDIAVRLEWPGKPHGYILFDRSWSMKDNGGTWKFSPNDGTGIKEPLKVGNQWSFQSDDSDTQHGTFFKRSGKSKVVAAETVTTSAGTFETFKIETAIIIKLTNDATKKYESNTTTWYAPSINHWVKRTTKFLFDGRTTENTSTVLVEYGRR